MLGGPPWIVSKRQKTGVPFQIKLMDIPMQIVKRYEPFRISPIRDADATTAAEEETRLQVIAHDNYTLRFRSCGFSRGD